MKLQVVCNECFKKLTIDGGFTNLKETMFIIPVKIGHKCNIKDVKK